MKHSYQTPLRRLHGFTASRLHGFTAILLFALAAFFASGVRAQTPSDVGTPDGRSPSITSFEYPNGMVSNNLVCAFVVNNAQGYQRIHVATSTDDGASWTDHGAPDNDNIPSGIVGLNGEACMNDPQISVDFNGDDVSLVARGYDQYTQEGNYEGDPGAGFPTLFENSGIYYCHSTDGGVTWTPWQTVVHEYSTLNPSTVDHPRIAIRRDYDAWVNDVPGCIVWEQRSFSKKGDGTIPSTSISTKLGMAFYNDGTVYPTTGANYYAGIQTEANVNSSYTPQRPSIAISPDGQIWLSYYVVTSYTYALADYYVQSGTVSLSGSPAKTTVNFTTTNMQKVASAQTLSGYYDDNRGYFYCPESQLYPDFNVEFAQGPSIQVAVSNLYQCEPSYTVGLVYTRADDGIVYNDYTTQVDQSNPNCNQWLSFWYASVSFDGVPQSVTWNERDKLNAPQSGPNWEMSFLPVLKYTLNLQDNHRSLSPAGKASRMGRGGETVQASFIGRHASYFVLSYIFAERCYGNNMGGNTLDYAQCETGVSFDNTFDDGIFQVAEPLCNNLASAVSLDNLGTKIDVCGEQGNLQVHTAWHHFQVGSTCSPSDQLWENNGGAIIAQAYLEGYPYNDPNAYPAISGSPYHYFNYDGLLQPTSLSFPSTYSSPANTAGIADGLGGFDFDKFEPAISVSPVPYGLYWGEYKGATKTDFGSLGSSDQRKIVMTENIAHAVFVDNSTVYYSMGMPSPDASATDRAWTQPIAIGGTPAQNVIQTLPSIGVYEEDGVDAIRAAEEALGVKPTSILPESPDRYNGLSSIAISWTELTPISGTNTANANIKMRTREFNACTGQWYDWSPVYTVYQSPVTYEMDQTFDNVSNPVPVTTVSPLAYPPIDPVKKKWIFPQDKYGTYFTFLPTNLIGWVTTWSDDNGDYDGVLNPGGVSIRSKTLLRQLNSNNEIDNTNWGTYSDPTNPNSFVPPGPSTSNMLYNNSYAQLTSEFYTYVSSTSQENKAEDSIDASLLSVPKPTGYTSNPRPANYAIDVAFSTSDGQTTTDGYGNPLEPGLATGSAIYGTEKGSYGIWQSNGQQIQVFSPIGLDYYLYANNPDITVNSSGQQFMAWQVLSPTWFSPLYPAYTTCGITAANTYYKGNWQKGGYSNVYSIFSEDITKDVSPAFSWIRNPSIAGEPKTMKPNNNYNSALDYDLGQVGLLFWQEDDQNGYSVNKLREWDYDENPGLSGVPNTYLLSMNGWAENENNAMFPTIGTNPQASFSTFTDLGASGPSSLLPSLMMGNSATTANQFSDEVEVGSAKIGVFDTVQDFAEYRSESRTSDSATAKFVWGDAYVTEPGDTIPEQIELGGGLDTAGWSSHNEIRDSIFRTQPFELDLGATVSYFRGGYMLGSDSLAAVSGLNQSDSMRYDVEMVHGDGQVDTLERLTFAPGAGEYLFPATITTQPSLAQTDTVYLRVEGSVFGFSGADSLCRFANEINFGHYTSVVDSTLAQKQATPFAAPSPTALQVMPLYPNPIMTPGSKATIILSCPKGLTANIVITDATGKFIGESFVKDGTGNWQTYSVPVPESDGDYFVRISDGLDSKVLPFSVIR